MTRHVVLPVLRCDECGDAVVFCTVCTPCDRRLKKRHRLIKTAQNKRWTREVVVKKLLARLRASVPVEPLAREP